MMKTCARGETNHPNYACYISACQEPSRIDHSCAKNTINVASTSPGLRVQPRTSVLEICHALSRRLETSARFASIRCSDCLFSRSPCHLGWRQFYKGVPTSFFVQVTIVLHVELVLSLGQSQPAVRVSSSVFCIISNSILQMGWSHDGAPCAV